MTISSPCASSSSWPVPSQVPATAAGGVDSTVNLGLTLLPGGLAVVGLFVIGCFISTSMGTSVGTISALAPIAVGISEKTGFAMALCLGAVVSGAMFGDNLSMISDTTIAATKTQGCEMKDKFRTNFLIVLPAAIINIVILLVITMNANYAVSGDLSYNFLQVVPYLVVLIGRPHRLQRLCRLGRGHHPVHCSGVVYWHHSSQRDLHQHGHWRHEYV